LIDNVMLIAAPYAAYLTGQAIHVSGVLATVVAGIQLSRRSTVTYSPETRLIGTNVWTLWIFLLNAYVFLTIGLQLKPIMQTSAAVRALPAALLLSALLIVVRLVWVFISTRGQPRSWTLLMGWSGMRGIVSLAAALALPYDFPARGQILIVTFVVILVTLVGQGITLIPLVRRLHIKEESSTVEHDLEVRVKALEAGLRAVERMARLAKDEHEVKLVNNLRGEYEARIELLGSHLREKDHEEWTEHSEFDRKIQKEALRAERSAVREMRDRGEIPDEIFRRIQYDLDLAEARLM
jgi:CPA1 family monovalent cation:H+ antiporter